jgi:hypothetical protein
MLQAKHQSDMILFEKANGELTVDERIEMFIKLSCTYRSMLEILGVWIQEPKDVFRVSKKRVLKRLKI